MDLVHSRCCGFDVHQQTVVAGVLAVLFPNSTQWLADRVGVVRGADLLLYGLALVLIYLVGSPSVRFREQEARLRAATE